MAGAYTVSAQQGSASMYSLSVEISSSSSSGSTSTGVETAEVSEVVEVDTSEPGLNLSATGVEGSSTIDVSGTTDRSGDITLKVIAPNGNIVSVSQITPSGGGFSVAIETGGALWTQDGMYTISAHQGDASSYQKSAQIEVVDGHVIPEFGVIAGVILAVAIASIIAVSAKSRLALVPKY
jgi:predicted secreted protein with PEFG-CTERM motif